MRKWVEVFNGIFAEDNYTPITVESVAEFKKITDVYPFNDENLDQVSVFALT